MSTTDTLLDEPGMIDQARKTIEDLRRHGISATELRRLENLLKEGSIGEALMLSSLLKTILNETSPDASQKKLLEVYRCLEESCHALVELSRNIFDVEVWQHYRASGYESFDSYCQGVFGVPPSKIQNLKLIKDQCLPRPGKGGPAELFSWFFDAVEMMADGKKEAQYLARIRSLELP
jgi:hypothetical protein